MACSVASKDRLLLYYSIYACPHLLSCLLPGQRSPWSRVCRDFASAHGALIFMADCAYATIAQRRRCPQCNSLDSSAGTALAHPVVPSTLPPVSSRVIHAAPAPVPIHAPIPILVPAPDAALPATTQSVTIAAPIPPTAASILDYARRNAGAIDRAVRKENRPYIIAAPDSPGIRLRAGIERAHDLAPPKLWEAPKVDELVNQTGDGARRTRVITANGTYCISERAPTTSIDIIETHGKIRLTNCPQHEDVATHQDWRTGQGN